MIPMELVLMAPMVHMAHLGHLVPGQLLVLRRLHLAADPARGPRLRHRAVLRVRPDHDAGPAAGLPAGGGCTRRRITDDRPIFAEPVAG